MKQRRDIPQKTLRRIVHPVKTYNFPLIDKRTHCKRPDILRFQIFIHLYVAVFQMFHITDQDILSPVKPFIPHVHHFNGNPLQVFLLGFYSAGTPFVCIITGMVACFLKNIDPLAAQGLPQIL